MKIVCEIKVNLKTTEVLKKCEEATRLGLRDTIRDIANDAMKLSPKKTGNNFRSIRYEVSGIEVPGDVEGLVDDNKLEAAAYSTSGYGGYLETGTYKMPARPYFRPALDMHKQELIPNIKRHLEA